MSTALALPALDAGAPLSRYLAQINRFPMLDPARAVAAISSAGGPHEPGSSPRR